MKILVVGVGVITESEKIALKLAELSTSAEIIVVKPEQFNEISDEVALMKLSTHHYQISKLPDIPIVVPEKNIKKGCFFIYFICKKKI